MRNARLIVGALAAVLATAGSTVAGDNTVLLGGVGTPSRSSMSAATVTLKGTAPSPDDTLPVCCWWRAWRWGYGFAPIYAPVVYSAPVYYGPTYAPAPTVAPPPAPAAFYQPAPLVAEQVTVAPSPRPSIVVGYQGRLFSGSLTLRPFARPAAVIAPSPAVQERMPGPRPTDGYRYDGGPANPVPMPVPDPVSPTDPVPTTVPALHRVMVERSRAKAAYPAYGERPAARPVEANPILVKRPIGR